MKMVLQTNIDRKANFKNFFSEFSNEMQECIQNCIECHQVCLRMIQHCLKEGGAHAEPSHIRLLQDCAEICATSANFMIRDSSFHHATCGACAELCRACDADCEKFGDDEMMRSCAEVCNRCADSCESMSKSH
jgi:hypothetical protein